MHNRLAKSRNLPHQLGLYQRLTNSNVSVTTASSSPLGASRRARASGVLVCLILLQRMSGDWAGRGKSYSSLRHMVSKDSARSLKSARICRRLAVVKYVPAVERTVSLMAQGIPAPPTAGKTSRGYTASISPTAALLHDCTDA